MTQPRVTVAARAFGRREALRLLGALGALGCNAPDDWTAQPWQAPKSTSPEGATAPLVFVDSVDAAFETLLPAERDANGVVVSPGAREAGADRVLATEGFGLLALAQGYAPGVPERVITLLKRSGNAFRVAANAELDALASLRRPLVPFRDLSASQRHEIALAALDDPAHDPAHRATLLILRAACFSAYLGAVTSDVGLHAVGFPKFEDWETRLAVSGYPRTKSGRLLDAERDDLAALAAKGDLDDYTFNREPAATVGDDLSAVVDANGDLV